MKISIWPAAVLGFAVLTLNGCTTSKRDMYKTVQANRIAECNRMEGRMREDCLAQHDMSYEEYERELEND